MSKEILTFGDIEMEANEFYCCIISLISENEAIKLMQNADLTEKSGTLLSGICYHIYD